MTAILNLAQPDERLAAAMRLAASRFVFDRRDTLAAQRIIRACSRYHAPTSAWLIYTRDSGMHECGWFKNPDYDRARHLSISFLTYDKAGALHCLPFDRRMAEKWARIFFGDDVRQLWIEPPFSPEGKVCGVHHYRLMCDKGWNPITPRGEVYSREHTPAGWLSWSDQHGEEELK